MTDEAAAQAEAEAKGGGGLMAWSSSTAPHHDENAREPLYSSCSCGHCSYPQ
jgi:hypothetical protein